MPVHAAIRIRMTDRPGALSAVGAALAANGVDIVSLDVVSHEGSAVVDDLALSAATQADIDRAVQSFFTDVTVQRFPGTIDDPAIALGRALARVATAAGVAEAREAVTAGALAFLHGDVAAYLRATPDGSLVAVAATVALPSIEAADPFSGWDALSSNHAFACLASEGWAPIAFHEAFGAHALAIAPCGTGGLLIVGRKSDIIFYGGEVDRLAVYAKAAGSIVAKAA